jgi:Undecaprenyl-phosphate galactose phosphotransferase WbaP
MITLELPPSEAPLAPRAFDVDRRAREGSRDSIMPRLPTGSRQTLVTAIPLMAADLLAVFFAFLLALQCIAAFWPAAVLDRSGLAIALAAAVVVANLAVELYPGIGLSPIGEFRLVSAATALIAPIFLCVSLLQGWILSPTQVAILLTCCLLLLILPISRSVARGACSRFAWWGQAALVVGKGKPALSTYAFLDRNPRLGLRPVGIVSDAPAVEHRVAPQFLGPESRAGTLSKELQVPWLIVAMPERPQHEVQAIAHELSEQGPHRTLISHLDGSPSLWDRASRCVDWPGSRETVGQGRFRRWIKRSIDLSLGSLLALVTLPLMLVIAALIRLTSPGPAILRQERVGLHGRRFIVWKFRTMICDGDRVLSEYLDACPGRREAWNRDHKLPYDPRITTIGRLLRKTSLDELPQLWNVLRGEMSLVGPRPILAAEIPDFGNSWEAFCSVLPGITGLWQVSGRNRTTYAEHVEMDRYYARNWSLGLDLYILFLTFKVVLFRDGAY